MTSLAYHYEEAVNQFWTRKRVCKKTVDGQNTWYMCLSLRWPRPLKKSLSPKHRHSKNN